VGELTTFVGKNQNNDKKVGILTTKNCSHTTKVVNLTTFSGQTNDLL
jgi:hypothetical protein